ncbi:hypothetical protein HMPREF9072_01880 [Capnocytophaga sp. oral taxon 324 str. F0483]|nr:hypothetical protein HMPREF9072_01880 [Capnocytophaga sp. oral taxon 324 str. F0483]
MTFSKLKSLIVNLIDITFIGALVNAPIKIKLFEQLFFCVLLFSKFDYVS